MTLLESLLDAIVRLEGDALVMHVGEKPYVVTTSSSMNAYRGPLAWGQVELSSRVLTSEAVLSMVGQILPPDQRQALDDLGAVEHEISAPYGIADRFTVVAARGGDDIWLELRRHPATTAEPAMTQPAAMGASEAANAIAESGTTAVGLQEHPPMPPDEDITVVVRQSQEEPPDAPTVVETTIGQTTVEETTIEERVPVLDEVGQHAPEHVEHILIPVNVQGTEESQDSALEVVDPEPQHSPTDADVDALLAATAGVLLTSTPDARDGQDADSDAPTELILIEQEEEQQEAAPVMMSEPPPAAQTVTPMPVEPAAPELAPPSLVGSGVAPVELTSPEEPAAQPISPVRVEEPAVSKPEPEVAVARARVDGTHAEPQTPVTEKQVDQSAAMPKFRPEHHEPVHAGGVVVPLSRTGRPEKPTPGGRVDDEALLQMLRVAAERGASTVYVVAQSRPMIRVDGEISALEAEPILSAADIERLVSSLAPRKPDAPAVGQVEWISEVPEVGRVRCLTFRDHRGPGLIFRMISARSISADHLNLTPEIRDLCAQADGFVLVTGARGSGKSTLLNSFVDLINRTRSDHVITVESEIGFVHESRRSFISQREVHDDPAAAASAAHAALTEDPDVLVIEDLHSPESVSAALEAAESGRLVFASITASSSAAAIDALVEMFPAGQRAAIRNTLSRTLRAVVSQVLLRKATGGRITARELLLNSPAVAASIREGKSSDVAAALESGQRHGMVSMNDSLAGLVRGGTVHSAEAYRRAPDRAALLACLARDGVDTSFAERLA